MLKHDNFTALDGAVTYCKRDHCTPEERAVIDTVNRFYETPERPKPRFISPDCDTAHCTDRERDLLDALLAVRAKRGEVR